MFQTQGQPGLYSVTARKGWGKAHTQEHLGHTVSVPLVSAHTCSAAMRVLQYLYYTQIVRHKLCFTR